MGLMQQHLQNLYYLQDNIDEIAKGIIQDNSEEILNVLKEQQLGIGEYYTGRPLKFKYKGNEGSGWYAKGTQLAANADNAITDKPEGQPYNFQWTGTTFSTMALKLEAKDSYSIFTRDGKESLLRKIYGDKLFKLSKENNDWVNKNILEPKLVIFIEEHWWRSIT
jgi:hypothetical protein